MEIRRSEGPLRRGRMDTTTIRTTAALPPGEEEEALVAEVEAVHMGTTVVPLATAGAKTRENRRDTHTLAVTRMDALDLA